MFGQLDDLPDEQYITRSVHMAVLHRMHFLQTKCNDLTAENEKLTRQLDESSTFADLALGIIGNRNVPDAYAKLYISMISLYPSLLQGQAVLISPWRIREDAGWKSKECATKFLRDLVEIGAGDYDSGRFEDEQRLGKFTPHLDVFLDVRNFNFKDLEKVKKNREAAAQRNKVIRLRCVSCDGELLYEGACPKCHQRYPLEAIPAKDLSVKKHEMEKS